MVGRYPGIKQVPIPGGLSVSTRMVRDNFKRHKIADEEVNRVALRYIARNTQLPVRTRIEAQLQLDAMPGYTRAHQASNRCVLSGYGRGIITDFRMCKVSKIDIGTSITRW